MCQGQMSGSVIFAFNPSWWDLVTLQVLVVSSLALKIAKSTKQPPKSIYSLNGSHLMISRSPFAKPIKQKRKFHLTQLSIVINAKTYILYKNRFKWVIIGLLGLTYWVWGWVWL